MTAHELYMKNVERIQAHSAGFNPDTGEKYEVEEYDILEPPLTLGEIMELIANGQPINALYRDEDSDTEDVDGASDDDAKEFRKIDDVLADSYESYDDKLLFMAAMKRKLKPAAFQEFQRDVAEQAEPSPVEKADQSSAEKAEPAPAPAGDEPPGSAEKAE